MRLEEEIKSSRFDSELHKAQVNILFSAAWLKHMALQVFKQYQLTQEQFNVLRILRGQYPKPICMMDIASRMIERNSNVTRIVEKLLTKELAERLKSEHDKREVRIAITTSGLALLDALDKDMHKAHQGNLTEEEAQLLNSLLDKMRDLNNENVHEINLLSGSDNSTKAAE